MKKFLYASMLMLVLVTAALVSADFSNTYTVSTNVGYVNRPKAEIARLARNANDFIAHYNTMTKYGYIPLPLTGWREVVDNSGDVGNIAANGGVLASDTTPTLASHSSPGATYDAQVINWVASNSDRIIFQAPVPEEFTGTYDIIFQGRFGNNGNTDTTGPTISFFFNEYVAGVDATGDALDTTADTVFVEYTATVPAASIPADVDTVTVMLTPAAHTTNTLRMSTARIKFQRSL